MFDSLSRFRARTMLAPMLVLTLCLHPTRARADQPWSTSGNWSIYMDPGDNCFVGAAFQGGWIFGVSLTAERQTIAVLGGPIPYQLNARPETNWKMSDGTSYSAQGLVTASDPGKRLLTMASAEFLSKLELSPSLRIEDANGKVASLALEGTQPAIAELRRCQRELIKLDTGSGLPAATGPVAQNLSTLITADDYPASALRAETSGRTSVALTISAHGLVSDCSVTASSGNVDLDTATCRLMQRRARFTPATDAAGKATGARYETSVNWQIPRS